MVLCHTFVRPPWFPYIPDKAILRKSQTPGDDVPWFPYIPDKAILGSGNLTAPRVPWFPYIPDKAILNPAPKPV